MTGQKKGKTYSVYLQEDDLEIVRRAQNRAGNPFSSALRFIIRQWAEYDELFTDPEQAQRVLKGIF